MEKVLAPYLPQEEEDYQLALNDFLINEDNYNPDEEINEFLNQSVECFRMSEEESVKCYNIGCRIKSFNPSENSETACEFHPGKPYFHDGKQEWPCCNRVTTDFSAFMDIKGCTKGPHNPNKPAEPEKPKLDPKYDKDVVVVEAPKPAAAPPAAAPAVPPEQVPYCILRRVVAPNHSDSVEKRLSEMELVIAQKKKDGVDENGGDTKPAPPIVLKRGMPCQNGGCNATFKDDEEADKSKCQHHSGVAIFHEGMKYWSCCKKKTSDFDAFRAQPGCKLDGVHEFRPKPQRPNAPACRTDMHETGDTVVYTLYVKHALHERCEVHANGTHMRYSLMACADGPEACNICHHGQEVMLFGPIDPTRSVLTISPSKVEIKLHKSVPMTWGQLARPVQKKTGGAGGGGGNKGPAAAPKASSS